MGQRDQNGNGAKELIGSPNKLVTAVKAVVEAFGLNGERHQGKQRQSLLI